MKAVMKTVVAVASIAGVTMPAAAQPVAAGFYFGAPSVAVTVGPRPYYRGARYVWGHYYNGYFQADPHWVAYEGSYAYGPCRASFVRGDDGLVRRVRGCF